MRVVVLHLVVENLGLVVHFIALQEAGRYQDWWVFLDHHSRDEGTKICTAGKIGVECVYFSSPP